MYLPLLTCERIFCMGFAIETRQNADSREKDLSNCVHLLFVRASLNCVDGFLCVCLLRAIRGHAMRPDMDSFHSTGMYFPIMYTSSPGIPPAESEWMDTLIYCVGSDVFLSARPGYILGIFSVKLRHASA